MNLYGSCLHSQVSCGSLVPPEPPVFAPGVGVPQAPALKANMNGGTKKVNHRALLNTSEYTWNRDLNIELGTVTAVQSFHDSSVQVPSATFVLAQNVSSNHSSGEA